VHDIEIMQSLKPIDDLDSYLPDIVLRKASAFFLVLLNLLEEVTTISIFHNYAEVGLFILAVVHKRLEVSDDVRVALYAGQDSHLVYGILPLFVAQPV